MSPPFIFSKFGNIEETKIITDRETGRSRGFGFVEMADEKAGQEAIEKLNGSELDGRALVVSQAKTREDR